MRHLFALLILSLGLAACDDSTTAPTDTIPGPPNAPRLTLTVLTGTKAAPVDSPTVKIQWWYTDSVTVAGGGLEFNSNTVATGSTILVSHSKGIGDTLLKVGCGGMDSVRYMFSVVGNGVWSSDTAIVHCK